MTVATAPSLPGLDVARTMTTTDVALLVATARVAMATVTAALAVPTMMTAVVVTTALRLLQGAAGDPSMTTRLRLAVATTMDTDATTLRHRTLT